jgi:hypothetical protein
MQRKPQGETITVHRCDFVRLELGSRFDHILMSRNTLLGLPDQELQVAAVQAAARHLTSEGRLYIDLGMPDPTASTAIHYGGTISEGVVLIQRSHDRLRQLVDLKLIILGGNENAVLQYWSRYIWTAELDLIGRLAGLELIERWSNWQGDPFNRPVRGVHQRVHRTNEPCSLRVSVPRSHADIQNAHVMAGSSGMYDVLRP